MSNSKYPLIESLGLYLDTMLTVKGTFTVVQADDLERVLEKAPVVYAEMPAPEKLNNWTDSRQTIYGANTTHTARLLCIQPIAKPDTAESLLREYIETHTFGAFTPKGHDEFIDRAKRLLEGK